VAELDVLQLLPRLLDLQKHLGELAMAQATISRQQELARAKRLQSDLIEAGLPTRKSAKRKAKARASGTKGTDGSADANGHATVQNRIAGLLQ